MGNEILHAFFFFEFVALILTLLLTKAFTGWIGRKKRLLSGETPMDLFLSLWSGKDEDELYTWYKVRSLMIQKNVSETELLFIEDQIRSVSTKSIKGSTYVNQIGDIQA
jgi:hypothetical protein